MNDDTTAAELAEILPANWRRRLLMDGVEYWTTGDGRAEVTGRDGLMWRAYVYGLNCEDAHGFARSDCRFVALRRAVAAEHVSRGQADPGVAALFCVGVALVEWCALVTNSPPKGIRGLLGSSIDAMVDDWEQEVFDRTMILKALG